MSKGSAAKSATDANFATAETIGSGDRAAVARVVIAAPRRPEPQRRLDANEGHAGPSLARDAGTHDPSEQWAARNAARSPLRRVRRASRPGTGPARLAVGIHRAFDLVHGPGAAIEHLLEQTVFSRGRAGFLPLAARQSTPADPRGERVRRSTPIGSDADSLRPARRALHRTPLEPPTNMSTIPTENGINGATLPRQEH